MNKQESIHTIYYYSDCPFFAGCENMIANFLNDESLHSKYNLRLVYRYSKEYQIGLSKRIISNLNRSIPVTLLSQFDYNSRFKLIKLFFKAIFIPFKFLTIFINTVILYKVFKREKIELLHINNGGYPGAISCYSAVFAAKLLGIKKIVYVVNNLTQPYNNIARYFDKPLDMLVVNNVNKFITSSIAAGKVLVDTLNIRIENYLTINNGISIREITINKNDFKSIYNIPKDKIIFSTIANFEVRKGHKYLLEAIHSITIDKLLSDKIHFLLEGDGPEKKSILDYISQHNLEEKIQILDNVKDIYNLYNITDVLILPSIGNEDFPNVILEAMSLGIPVIGTNIAGIPEQIDNLLTGIVIKPKSGIEIKNAIIEFCNNTSLIEYFSKNAKEKFTTMYNKSIALEKYHYLYYNLLNNN